MDDTDRLARAEQGAADDVVEAARKWRDERTTDAEQSLDEAVKNYEIIHRRFLDAIGAAR